MSITTWWFHTNASFIWKFLLLFFWLEYHKLSVASRSLFQLIPTSHYQFLVSRLNTELQVIKYPCSIYRFVFILHIIYSNNFVAGSIIVLAYKYMHFPSLVVKGVWSNSIHLHCALEWNFTSDIFVGFFPMSSLWSLNCL